ncbi:hypothetical protein E3N88_32370 [Mikania micrantha]|uniref:MIF4G domain-containing protein n=1 Tax=Mikania micrantha TaxID=192012 RepID=A0A5N6M9L2_9ASTR|nr:hypothetical protein E3N88_32370 [Mikania micrantha]
MRNWSRKYWRDAVDSGDCNKIRISMRFPTVLFLLQCSEQLPHKIPLYGTLIGLLNLENEEFVNKILESTHKSLQDALDSGDCNKIRVSMRFLTVWDACFGVVRRELDHSEDEILTFLLQCTEQLPHKIPLYGTLIGLLNLENEEFVKKILESTHKSLQDALDSGDCNKIRVSMRFLTVLVFYSYILRGIIVSISCFNLDKRSSWKSLIVGIGEKSPEYGFLLWCAVRRELDHSEDEILTVIYCLLFMI